MSGIRFILNGRPVDVLSGPDTPLLSVLRNECGQRATRFGCGLEQCGACMVLIDGEAVTSCARPIDSVAGKAVTTMEGLTRDGAPHLLLQAFLEEQAAQCGYCVSGILIAAAALLAANPRPSEAQIRSALDRNLCRCGVQNRMVRAVAKAGAMIEARGPE